MLKKNINVWFIVNIAVIAMITDYFCYFIKLDYIYSLLIGFISVVISNVLLFKKKIIKISLDFNIIDICFIVFLVTKIIGRISVPNYIYDVANYHLYLQENPFIDKINFDFFAGKNLNAFLFPLADRMFYIFRYFLGYRLGTILSYYTLAVIYYQLKNIISYFVKDKKNLICIFSLFSITSLVQLNSLAGSYYIDVVSVVFILEVISSVLYLEKNISKTELIYISLVIGLATAIKLPNLLIIGPAVLYLYFIKKLRINKKHILFLLIAIIPVLPYIIDNFIQTGSPIFPYYNNILKSKYFPYYSWKDHKFGINGIILKLIWPIYTSVIELGYGDGSQYYEPMWALGYLYVIIYMIVERNKKSDTFKFSILALIATFCWINFIEGYMRYAFVVPFLYFIVMSSTIIKKINIKPNKTVKSIVKYGFISLVSAYYIFICYINFNYYVKENYKYVFKDRNIKKIKIDGVWGTISDDSGLTVMVREKDTPIYNLEYKINVTNDITKKLYYEKVKNKDIYVLIDMRHVFKVDVLKDNGFEIVKIVKIYKPKDLPCLRTSNLAYLYKVRYVGNKNAKEKDN